MGRISTGPAGLRITAIKRFSLPTAGWIALLEWSLRSRLERSEAVGTATQMPAPSKEKAPPKLTVRLDCTALAPEVRVPDGAHAGVPGRATGAAKLIWYNPTKPWVRAAYTGMRLNCGFRGRALTRKLKSTSRLAVIGSGLEAGRPVTAGGS